MMMSFGLRVIVRLVMCRFIVWVWKLKILLVRVLFFWVSVWSEKIFFFEGLVECVSL